MTYLTFKTRKTVHLTSVYTRQKYQKNYSTTVITTTTTTTKY